MAIHNFANFDQYEINNIKSLTSSVNAITPVFKGVSFRWGYHATSFNAYVEKPTVEVDPLQRTWLRVQPISGLTTTARTGAIYVTNSNIDESLRTPGTVVMFSFRFGSCQGNLSSAAFLGYRTPSTSALTTLTNILDDRAKIGPNEYRWVDFRITYGANESCTVDVFCNKEKVYTFTAAGGLIWAVGAGNLSNSLSSSYGVNFGFWLNDFLTVIDKEGEVPTGLIGPVAVKSHAVSSVRTNGTWTPPSGKTIIDGLSMKLRGVTTQYSDSELTRTDPFGGTLTATFSPPEESYPILAYQETFIVQKPPSESASLQFQRIANGRPIGAKETITADVAGVAYSVTSSVVTPADPAFPFTAEDLGVRGIIFNSVKKTYKD